MLSNESLCRFILPNSYIHFLFLDIFLIARFYEPETDLPSSNSISNSIFLDCCDRSLTDAHYNVINILLLHSENIL